MAKSDTTTSGTGTATAAEAAPAAAAAAPVTSSASSLSRVLSGLGSLVSGVVGLGGSLPVVGGALDKTGEFLGRAVSFGKYSPDTSAATPVAAAGYGNDLFTDVQRESFRETLLSRQDERKQAVEGASFSPGGSAPKLESAGSKLEFVSQYRSYLDDLEASALDWKTSSSNANVDFGPSGAQVASDLDSAIFDARNALDVYASGKKTSADLEKLYRVLSRTERAKGSLGVIRPKLSAEEVQGIADLEEILGVVDGKTDLGRLYAGGKKNPAADKNNAETARLAAEINDYFKQFEDKTVEPGVLLKRAHELATKSRSLSSQYSMLRMNTYTRGFRLFQWDGTDLGFDSGAVLEQLKVVSPILLAGLSYYQEEKKAKRQHAWDIEDREDAQAFYASENALNRASSEAIAATESSSGSGSVGASSTHSLGGSIRSA